MQLTQNQGVNNVVNRQLECSVDYIICTYQIKLLPLQTKSNHINMENYTVAISLNSSTSIEFQARNIGCSAENGIALARIDESELLADKGFLFVNFGTQKASFSYDIFSFEWDVVDSKKADGHYFIKCTNGFNIVSIELTDPC